MHNHSIIDTIVFPEPDFTEIPQNQDKRKIIGLIIEYRKNLSMK